MSVKPSANDGDDPVDRAVRVKSARNAVSACALAERAGEVGEADESEFPLGLRRPRLVLTSEFGTASMRDWEIGRYLAEAGVDTFVPYTLEQARTLCRALALRRELHGTRFVVFQDDPGEGMQASLSACLLRLSAPH